MMDEIGKSEETLESGGAGCRGDVGWKQLRSADFLFRGMPPLPYFFCRSKLLFIQLGDLLSAVSFFSRV